MKKRRFGQTSDDFKFDDGSWEKWAKWWRLIKIKYASVSSRFFSLDSSLKIVYFMSSGILRRMGTDSFFLMMIYFCLVRTSGLAEADGNGGKWWK